FRVAETELKTGGSIRIPTDGADDHASERDAAVMAGKLARLERGRAAAGDGGVEQEDGEDGRDRERDDQTNGAPSTSHPGILVRPASRPSFRSSGRSRR